VPLTETPDEFDEQRLALRTAADLAREAAWFIALAVSTPSLPARLRYLQRAEPRLALAKLVVQLESADETG
jgi:hypothetical protein